MSLHNQRALVIGQGSIGQRHSRLLQQAGWSVDTVSRQATDSFRSIPEALATDPYDLAIIANVTSRHGEAVQQLAEGRFRDVVLIEKPLAANASECAEMLGNCSLFQSVAVGYNLRFHPVVQALRTELAGETIAEVRISVGQYLPDWRPTTDYKSGSSAQRALGGGALRDLSHEIDLLLHLFGPWERLATIGGNLSRLDIETDEAWAMLFRMKSGAVANVTLNYFDRPVERTIIATTHTRTLKADLFENTLSINGETASFPVERDGTYLALHRALQVNDRHLCSLAEAADVMAVIDAAERANETQTWIHP